MIRISDIQDGKVVWDTVPYCSIDKDEIETYLLQPNDILFARTGGTVGKSFLVQDMPYPAIYAGYLIRTRYSSSLSSQYMQFFMESSLYWSQLKEGTIATAQPNCNGKTLSKMILPIPPLNEQKRIVEKLSVLLKEVSAYSLLYNNKAKINGQIKILLRKSVLQEAIQGKLVPQDPNDEPALLLINKINEEKKHLVKSGILKAKDVIESSIFKGDDNKYYEKKGKNIIDITEEIQFDIPSNWIWMRFQDIALIYTGNSISESEKKMRYMQSNGIEYIATKDVGFDGSIDYNNGIHIPDNYQKNFKIAPKDSILLCIEGGSAGRKIAILLKDVCFGNKLCCFSPYNVLYNKYIYYYLQAPQFIGIFHSKRSGIIGGVSINNVKRFLIPIPPFEEQKRIVAKIEKCQ